jgi:PilZ domain
LRHPGTEVYNIGQERQAMRYSRGTRRITVSGEASVRLLLTDDADDGTLLDLSRQGARLRINRLFEPGQKLAIMLNLPWEEPAIEVRLAAVRWMKDNRIGIEFLKIQDDDRVSLDVFLAARSKLQESHA